MTSKVLAPASPFLKMQLKKSPEPAAAPEPGARVAHLEHSVRFLQDQHRSMLAGLHAEIEALRERNRDLQFQLIFNKESAPRPSLAEESNESNEEARLKRLLAAAQREGAAARGAAREAEARSLQLQQTLDAQAQKMTALRAAAGAAGAAGAVAAGVAGVAGAEAGALRARLADAERLVRRLRADAERQRRELACMKGSLRTPLPSSLDPYGFHNSYAFPPLPPDFYREPLREDYSRGGRRPLTLPELGGGSHNIHRATIFTNHNTTKPRANGFDAKKKSPSVNNENISVKSLEGPQVDNIKTEDSATNSNNIYPEIKRVITKLIGSPQDQASSTPGEGRRRRHRKHAPDHT